MADSQILVLDTTYVLPIFGIKPQISPSFPEELQLLWVEGYSKFVIYLPSVCLMEVAYKLNQEFRHSKQVEIIERYPLILPTVLTSPVIRIFQSYLDSPASQTAMKIRAAGHADLMDCWIAGSAAALHAVLITEDEKLAKVLRKLPETSNISCWNWLKLQNQVS